MKILAFDCSAGSASAALLDGERLVASSFINIKVTHSETLMPMVENMLKASQTDLSEIEGLAVNNGPGSFTGIRIGISAVKGLALPRRLPCVGVSTLLSMAYNFIDTDCTVCAVMDARCNQVYNALFDIKSGKVTRLCGDRALLCEELSEELKKMSQIETKHVIIVGDGTEVFYPYVEDLTNIYKSAPSNRFQNAVGTGFAALSLFEKDEVVPPEALLPVYLRLPQAERELNKKKG